MAKKNKIPNAVGGNALEMVMRDVLDCMEQMSLESGFSPENGGFEIIEIVPERPAPVPVVEEADSEDDKVVEFRPLRAAG